MSVQYRELKLAVQDLRKQGKTYTEIQQQLKRKVAKGTLSVWCREVQLNTAQRHRLENKAMQAAQLAREKAWQSNRNKRKLYLEQLEAHNAYLLFRLEDKDISKIALGILYAAEGAKQEGRASLMFGNSDPDLIKLYLKLLRTCYEVDESKFRFTVQCRADQDTAALAHYWSHITCIPLTQCYKPQVDSRTIGKPSRKLNYRGVCRIDYFSANIYNELRAIMHVLSK